jgi:phosphoglycolate phosphatase-like HAD superfamily hydrolase
MDFEKPFDLPLPGEVSPARNLWQIAREELADSKSQWLDVMFDVDGILFPFQRAYGFRLRGKDFEDDEIQEWGKLPAEWSREEQEAALLWCHSYQALNQFKFFSDAIEALDRLRRVGIKVHICTRREAVGEADLIKAMQEQGLAYDSVYCSRKVDKIKWCIERNVPIIVDDKPGTLQQAAANSLKAFSIRWPYNQHLHNPPLIRLADSWEQLTRLLLVCILKEVRCN